MCFFADIATSVRKHKFSLCQAWRLHLGPRPCRSTAGWSPEIVSLGGLATSSILVLAAVVSARIIHELLGTLRRRTKGLLTTERL